MGVIYIDFFGERQNNNPYLLCSIIKQIQLQVFEKNNRIKKRKNKYQGNAPAHLSAIATLKFVE